MQKKKYMSKRKKRLRAVLFAALGVAVIAGAAALGTAIERIVERSPEGAGTAASLSKEDQALVEELDLQEYEEIEPERTLFYKGKQYTYNDDLSVLLIMGIDDYGIQEYEYRNTAQADLYLVAVFDPADSTCTVLQLNRDTMTKIPVIGFSGTVIGSITQQLALAHTYGSGMEDSCQNAVTTVSNLLYGVDIDNYFALRMDSIAILNDMVGGVEVTIEDDFTGVDDTLVQGETVTLLGEHAEKYVRARYTMLDDATNLARMRRQRIYLFALLDKMRAAADKDSDFALKAYDAVGEYMVTDCTVNQLLDYVEKLSGDTLTEMIAPEGENIMGEKYMEFYVDEDALQQLVIDTFYEPVGE